MTTTWTDTDDTSLGVTGAIVSSLIESVKFAQIPRKPQSAEMVEKQAILTPLINSIFPDWHGDFIDNPLMDSVEVMMRKGNRFMHIVFYNDHFLKPQKERDAYFICLLQVVNQSHELKLEVAS